jgi:hypothetical protein
MSSSALDAEVRQRLANGEALKSIGLDAKRANIAPAAVTSSLILNGAPGPAVVTSLVESDLPVCTVVAAALSAGMSRLDMVTAAIAGGADPNMTCLLDPTAAGDTGSRFGQSRDPSNGGGGSQSVSPS